MKKIIVLFVIALSLQVSGQTSIALFESGSTVSISPNKVLQLGTQPSKFNKFTVDIQNTGSDTNTYLIVRYQIVANWIAIGDSAWTSFCFGGQCYGNDIITSPFGLELIPGEKSVPAGDDYTSLDCDIVEGSKVGYTLVKYTVINSENPSDSVQFSIRYNDPATVGIAQVNRIITDVSLFPNPAKDKVTLSVNSIGSSQSQLLVFNGIGDLVIEKALTLHEGKNTVNIDISECSKGVYVTQLKSAGGTVTKKFIKE